MQWSAGDNAGFTTAAAAWRGFQRNYQEANVAVQTDDPDSLLSHYRRLIQTRNDHAALRTGDWREVEAEDKRIYASLRHSAEETLLVLINLSGEPISDYSLNLDEGPLSVGSANEVFAEVPVSGPAVNASGGFDGYTPLAELAPYSTYIIRLEY
jgi:alpha-glucosidase